MFIAGVCNYWGRCLWFNTAQRTEHDFVCCAVLCGCWALWDSKDRTQSDEFKSNLLHRNSLYNIITVGVVLVCRQFFSGTPFSNLLTVGINRTHFEASHKGSSNIFKLIVNPNLLPTVICCSVLVQHRATCSVRKSLAHDPFRTEHTWFALCYVRRRFVTTYSTEGKGCSVRCTMLNRKHRAQVNKVVHHNEYIDISITINHWINTMIHLVYYIWGASKDWGWNKLADCCILCSLWNSMHCFVKVVYWWCMETQS